MAKHNLVAVYNSREEAERALDELLRFGIPAENIRLSAPDTAPVPLRKDEVHEERRAGFWDWLFGNDIPEHDQSWYNARLGEGRTVLSVLVEDDVRRDRIEDILETSNPVDFNEPGGTAMVDERGTSGLREPTTASPVIGAAVPGVGETREPMPAVRPTLSERAEPRAERLEGTNEDEQVIPVVKEELAVGKRASERRYRIRTYTVEAPVEESVRLRDERVVIERRPATSPVTTSPDAARDREFEVVERHEEPVVEKRVRPVEEVVVRREANDRVETVRDTVRETKVDVDKEPAEHRADIERDRAAADLKEDRVGAKPRVDRDERTP